MQRKLCSSEPPLLFTKLWSGVGLASRDLCFGKVSATWATWQDHFPCLFLCSLATGQQAVCTSVPAKMPRFRGDHKNEPGVCYMWVETLGAFWGREGHHKALDLKAFVEGVLQVRVLEVFWPIATKTRGLQKIHRFSRFPLYVKHPMDPRSAAFDRLPTPKALEEASSEEPKRRFVAGARRKTRSRAAAQRCWSSSLRVAGGFWGLAEYDES